MRIQPSAPTLLKVSDDTQMSIYTMDALKDILSTSSLNGLGYDVRLQDSVRKVFADHYVNFYHDSDNTRAPGLTCMGALEKYIETTHKLTGYEGSYGNNSMGCGTIMRTPWIGLLPLTRKEVILLAILQAQTTHWEPRGWFASAVASVIVYDALNTGDEGLSVFSNLFEYALKIVSDIREVGSNLVNDFVDGLDVFEASLVEASNKFEDFMTSGDDENVCFWFGEGWTSDETLFNALGVVSRYKTNVEDGLRRLVYSSGDSDSLAAVGGSFFGVLYPEQTNAVKPVETAFEARYRDELMDVIEWINHCWEKNNIL